jgi:hypothetical protein
MTTDSHNGLFLVFEIFIIESFQIRNISQERLLSIVHIEIV